MDRARSGEKNVFDLWPDFRLAGKPSEGFRRIVTATFRGFHLDDARRRTRRWRLGQALAGFVWRHEREISNCTARPPSPAADLRARARK